MKKTLITSLILLMMFSCKKEDIKPIEKAANIVKVDYFSSWVSNQMTHNVKIKNIGNSAGYGINIKVDVLSADKGEVISSTQGGTGTLMADSTTTISFQYSLPNYTYYNEKPNIYITWNN